MVGIEKNSKKRDGELRGGGEKERFALVPNLHFSPALGDSRVAAMAVLRDNLTFLHFCVPPALLFFIIAEAIQDDDFRDAGGSLAGNLLPFFWRSGAGH